MDKEIRPFSKYVVAVHEAAHSIIGDYVGIPTKGVTIAFSPEGTEHRKSETWTGRTDFEESFFPERKANVRISVAGHVSYEILTGQNASLNDSGSVSDYMTLLGLPSYLASIGLMPPESEIRKNATIAAAEDSVREYLLVNWDKVEKRARLLMNKHALSKAEVYSG